MMSISVNTEFHNPDCVRSVSVEPDGVLYIHFVGDASRCQMMPLSEFDRIAAEVATFRRLNAEAAEQERAASANVTVEQLLEMAGYGHCRMEPNNGDGRREIFRLSDGGTIGYMTAESAAEFAEAELAAQMPKAGA